MHTDSKQENELDLFAIEKAKRRTEALMKAEYLCIDLKFEVNGFLERI